MKVHKKGNWDNENTHMKTGKDSLREYFSSPHLNREYTKKRSQTNNIGLNFIYFSLIIMIALIVAPALNLTSVYMHERAHCEVLNSNGLDCGIEIDYTRAYLSSYASFWSGGRSSLGKAHFVNEEFCSLDGIVRQEALSAGPRSDISMLFRVLFLTILLGISKIIIPFNHKSRVLLIQIQVILLLWAILMVLSLSGAINGGDLSGRTLC